MEGKVHIDSALSNISVGYSNNEFISEQVFPVVPVDKDSDAYYKSGKERFRARDDMRAPGTEAKPSRMVLSDDSYRCDGHALSDSVPREKTNAQDASLNLLADTTDYLTEQVALRQEVNLVSRITTDMTAGSRVSSLTSVPWNNDANDPVAKIMTEIDTIAKLCGKRPNTLALSAAVFTAMALNAKVRGLLGGATDIRQTVVTPEQLAAALQLDRVLIASAVYDTAAEGQSASLAYVWGALALLFYRPASPGLKTISLGYTFHWRRALATVDGTATGVNGIGSQFVRRYFDDKKIADVVEVHKYYAQKTVVPEAGTLFTNCLG